MYLRVLGSAAGGGYPQWNCACPLCQLSRTDRSRSEPRSHDSLAISATGKNWYLVNASPDVRFQIDSFPAIHPGPGLRETPLRGVLLTDAELDHTTGLLLLREGARLDVFATRAILNALSNRFPVRQVIANYADFQWIELKTGEPFTLDDGTIQAEAFSTGRKRPRYVEADDPAIDWVIGYRFQDLQSGRVAVYAPAIESWTPELENVMNRANCVFVDGTFWSADEMVNTGIGRLTAKDMGHIPISGTTGSAIRLAALSCARKILIHINNTNPILDNHSQQYSELISRGIELGTDGMEIKI